MVGKLDSLRYYQDTAIPCPICSQGINFLKRIYCTAFAGRPHITKLKLPPYHYGKVGVATWIPILQCECCGYAFNANGGKPVKAEELIDKQIPLLREANRLAREATGYKKYGSRGLRDDEKP